MANTMKPVNIFFIYFQASNLTGRACGGGPWPAAPTPPGNPVLRWGKTILFQGKTI
jgi:hypothetical protein